MGLFGTLSESERRDLFEPVRFWLPKDREAVRQISRDIYSCFEQWKLDQVDGEGKVEAFGPMSLGLLASLPKGTMMPASKAEPWHCAGQFVNNEIDLAFKLWLDSYVPFETLLDKYGVCQPFAICGLVASQQSDVRAESLIRLNGFLSKQLAEFAIFASRDAWARGERARRQDDGLVKARLTSAQRRREKAVERDKQIYRMAVEYFQRMPGHGLDDAILHIKKYVSRISPGSIRAKIKGAKAEALRSMNTERPG